MHTVIASDSGGWSVVFVEPQKAGNSPAVVYNQICQFRQEEFVPAVHLVNCLNGGDTTELNRNQRALNERLDRLCENFEDIALFSRTVSSMVDEIWAAAGARVIAELKNGG